MFRSPGIEVIRASTTPGFPGSREGDGGASGGIGGCGAGLGGGTVSSCGAGSGALGYWSTVKSSNKKGEPAGGVMVTASSPVKPVRINFWGLLLTLKVVVFTTLSRAEPVTVISV